jgi:Ca2+ transporting ATPase
MENAYNRSTREILKHFSVTTEQGLSDAQVVASREKYGRNAIAEEESTPLWELILEQFKDQLVLILLGSAAVSFVLALLEEGEGWTAFVDPAVVRSCYSY